MEPPTLPPVLFVCGDRNWTDGPVLHAPLREAWDTGAIIVTGGCRGADQLAEEAAVSLGYLPVRCPAPWSHYGRAAGPLRNAAMLRLLVALRGAGHPVTCFACHDNLAASRGTAGMLDLLRSHGFDVTLLSHTQHTERDTR